MAVELLLKNISDVHPNENLDRVSSLKRGDLVFAKQIPHDDWNEYETLPEFSRLILSDVNISGVVPYMQPWYLELDFQTLDYDSINDIYTVRMFSNTPGIAELGVINPTDLIHHLQNWNLTISGIGPNEIVFIADMKEVILSRNFWGGATEGLVITPISYDSVSNTHTMKISYSGYAVGKLRTDARSLVETHLLRQGITIERESIYGQLMEVNLPTSVIINKFKSDISEKTKKIVYARRYYISNVAMNAIQTYMINNSSSAMTTTAATLLSYLNDRLEEN